MGSGIEKETQLRLGGRGELNLLRDEHTAVSGICGISILSVSQEMGGQSASETFFPIEIGIRTEYFFNNWFSIHAEAGANLVFFGTTENTFVRAGSAGGAGVFENDASNIAIGAVETFGSGGFTFWFN